MIKCICLLPYSGLAEVGAVKMRKGSTGVRRSPNRNGVACRFLVTLSQQLVGGAGYHRPERRILRESPLTRILRATSERDIARGVRTSRIASGKPKNFIFYAKVQKLTIFYSINNVPDGTPYSCGRVR